MGSPGGSDTAGAAGAAGTRAEEDDRAGATLAVVVVIVVVPFLGAETEEALDAAVVDRGSVCLS